MEKHTMVTAQSTVRNPYISRGPVRSADMFYGRSADLWEIASFIGGNQSIAIVGQRKIGKTSLLFHLMRSEVRASLNLGAETVLVYVDCEMLGQGGTNEIFGQFASEIAASLQDAGLDAEPALQTAVDKPTRLAFEAALRRLNQRGLRIVLILDEFERISTNDELDLNFFNALRSAAARYPLVFITASARPLIELTYSGRSQEILSSPFFNIFAPLFLGLLSEEEAYTLISEPAERVGKPFPAVLRDTLYKLAGGHPLSLQVACFHAFNTPDDPAAITSDTERELYAHFQYYWHNLSPIEQDTLRRIGEAASQAHNDTTLRLTLRDLSQKGLIVAKDDSYCYPSQAWADFVASQDNSPATTRLSNGLLTGSRIGPYEILDMLGRGGMAEVYRAVHTRLDRTVAVKVLSPSLAREDDFRRRFEREARSIAALKHPNIVGVFDFGDLEGVYYMVMEYVAGQSLDRFLQQAGALSLDQALPLMRDLATALDYAHAQGIVHRDIKPANVMLDPVHPSNNNTLGFRAVLTDFGIAKLLANKDGSKTDGLTGTLDYIAPEQIRSAKDIDGRADIYALGVVLYQILTGKLPFTGENPAEVLMGHLEQPAPDPRRVVPAMPGHIALAIQRAMAKAPSERFPTVAAFVGALE